MKQKSVCFYYENVVECYVSYNLFLSSFKYFCFYKNDNNEDIDEDCDSYQKWSNIYVVLYLGGYIKCQI